MKLKNHILFAFMAIATIACTKGNMEIEKPSGRYIFFEPEMLKIEQTKADLLDEFPTEKGTAFGVLGYYEDYSAIFTGYENNIAEVYYNGEAFKYDNLAPWLGEDQKAGEDGEEGTPGALHTFYGFYPYSLDVDIDETSKVPYINYTQPEDAEKMIDILGTYTQVEKTAYNNDVDLTFQHLLWAFTISIQNAQEAQDPENPTDATLRIKSVKLSINDLLDNALFYLDENFTLATDETSTIDVDYTIYSNSEGKDIKTTETETFGPLLFVPTSSIFCKIQIDYISADGGEHTFIYPSNEYIEITHENGEGEASGFIRGNVYNLTIKKNTDNFTVVNTNITDWGTLEEDITHTFE